MKVRIIFISIIFFSLTLCAPPSDAAFTKQDNVVSNTSPIIFTRNIHNTSLANSLIKEHFQIFASMYFWQTDAKKLAIFSPGLDSFAAYQSYPFTPLYMQSNGEYFTIGGKCTAPLAGMSSCPSIVRGRLGVDTSVEMTSPGLLDNHELTRDRQGNFWAIRYLAYPANYFPDFINYSSISSLEGTRNNIDKVSDCEIVKFDKSGNILFRWSALANLPPSEIRFKRWEHNPTGIIKTGNDGLTYADLFHCNSIDLNKNGKTFLISARHTDSIYEVDIKSKNVNWKLGGNYWKEKSLSIFDDEIKKKFEGNLMSGQHDARYVSNSQISILDNSTNENRAARGLLLSLDLPLRKAKLIHKYSDPNGFPSGCTGSFREIVGIKRWYVAGWGCTESGITIFDSAGKPVVSLEVAENEVNDVYRPIIPIARTRSMISYRVTPFLLKERLISQSINSK